MFDLDLPFAEAINSRGSELRGVLERIVYPREGVNGNGFMIARIRVDGKSEAVKGTCLAPQVGATYRFRGKWEPGRGNYGPTFAFESYDLELPTDPPAIVQYLMSAAKWIGERVGEAIVDRYGEDTLKVLKTDPERVAREISSLTLARAQEIQAMLVANEQIEAVTIGLTDLFHGTKLGAATVQKALEQWQHEALAVVTADPFALLELHGVGFKLADDVRIRLGMPHDSPERIQAGILHALDEAAGGDGHTYLPDTDFRARTMDLLRVPMDAIEAQMFELTSKEHVHVRETDLLGLRGYDVASYRLWRAERSIADQLTAMLEYGTTRLAELNATPSAVGDAPELNTDGLAADQIEALRKMQGARVFVLTGAPGTGKTYLVKRILASLGSARVALAAPTGKASMRMMEQTGQSASTIHRLLEPTPSNGRYYFARNADNPLEVDVVVLDECSMIDVTLMASFLDALPLSARLILIGDTNQLPPVGAGNVLRDIISSGVVETAELTAIKRQDAGLIIRNCHAIRDGHDITYENDPDDDFLWQDEQDEMTIANAVIDMVARRFPARGFSPTRDVQVITPKREKGELSCKALNKRLQAALNPNIPAENSRFAPGDKVIQLKNDNGLGIYNGDIGRLDAIDTGARTYTVTFENPERQVVIKWPADIDLAYAITCHKFQGSEAPAVVIPIHRSQGPRILQRSWLYTAISRARKLCVGVGQFNETPKIIRRQAQVRRYTQLEQFLREGVRS